MAEVLDSRPQASSIGPSSGTSFFSSIRNPLAVLLGDKVTAAAEEAAAAKVKDVILSTADKKQPTTRVMTTGNAAANLSTAGGGPAVIQQIATGGPSDTGKLSTATAAAPPATGLFGTPVKPLHLAIGAALVGGLWFLSRSR